MKDCQPCQSEAEARLSFGSAIAAPAITISLKSSLSTAKQHRREEPYAVIALSVTAQDGGLRRPHAIKNNYPTL